MKEYSKGDDACFRVEDRIVRGFVVVIDTYYGRGGEEYHEYDIFVEEENMLYKHIREEELVETKGYARPIKSLDEEILRDIDNLKKPRWESGYLISKLGK